MRTLFLLLLSLLMAAPLAGQSTRAERTNAGETSSFVDVVAFLDSLQHRTPDIRRWTLATSPEGKPVPVVLAARPMVWSPEQAHRSGKPLIYVQANIHAGEVEGKEAAQMLLRDITVGPLKALLDSVNVLVVPIYNADGNDRFGPADQNRPGQNGPAVVGLRPNGQGYDLNRDYVKMEAPETRGSVALVDEWGPDVWVDLHTTNGSYHGYVLTYSPGLNPNSPPANDYTRDVFLPEIRQRMRARHKQETFWYGNFDNQDPDSIAAGGWRTYEPGPRFGSNVMGIRGRVSILSEAYSNAPFQERIDASYNFVREILSLAAERRDAIHRVIDASARTTADSVAVRSTYGPPTMQDVIAETTYPDDDGSGPFARRKRTGQFRTLNMPVYDRFVAERKVAMPAAYLIPPYEQETVRLLLRQGVVVERVGESWKGSVQAFTVDSIRAAARPFQGHRMVSVEGAWSAADTAGAAGWYYVPTGQRLGLFAAFILEPSSEDGVVTWGMYDRSLQRGGRYPILRAMAPMRLDRRQVHLDELPTW